ncbi:DUF3142 domain-containing protein [Haloferula sargassicola]|uniref:Uncharacterized protein n=1 Tax=Haloferula sargassicola TaxID=490096 RepID=A0ABP9URI9_9BACT
MNAARLAALVLVFQLASAAPPAFWVWNRPDPLPEPALAELRENGSPLLYWQAAEVTLAHGWQDRLPAEMPAPAVVPVFRFEADPAMLFRPEGIAGLPSKIADPRPGWIQIDYDCPVSRLPDYAAALRRLKPALGSTRLSITALASWIGSPGFEELAGTVDEIVPMFYDLLPDRAEDVRAGHLVPMSGRDTLVWIRRWKTCPTRWRAGLPNFQRLTLFEADGSLVGHLPPFDPASLDGHAGLRLSAPPAGGTAIYQVTADSMPAHRPVHRNQLLVWRRPDEATMRQAIQAATEAGAAGVLWFAHPASAPAPWHSVSHLIHLTENPRPRLQLKVTDQGAIELFNAGPGDLPCRPGAKPWTLTLQGEPGDFVKPTPGHFADIAGSDGSLHRPRFSTTISLRFHQLPAGHSLVTGTHFSEASAEPDWQIDPRP